MGTLQLQPTTTALDPDTVVAQFRRLQRLLTADTSGLRDRLFGAHAHSVVAFTLTTSGASDDGLSAYVSIDPPEKRDAVERVLRTLLPNDYTVEEAETDPADVLPTGTADPTGNDEPNDATLPHAAVEYYGDVERREDWQTQLTPLSEFTEDRETRLPLAAIAERLATATTPMAYQAVCRPYRDWSAAAADRRHRLERGRDTPAQRFVDDWIGPTDEEIEPGERYDELAAKDARRSFVVNARVVAVGSDADAAIADLESAFEPVSHTWYSVRGRRKTGHDARAVREAIENRTVHPPTYDDWRGKLPWTANRSRAIIADAAEAPSFCLLDGTALTAAGDRGIDTTPGERTTIQRPPDARLQRYRAPGLTVGHPLDQDGARDDDTIAIPPSLQPLHVAWFGATGAGKSTALTNAILQNHAVTDGADILVDPKGDGMATDYLRAHYAEYGTLENVIYFDCADVLPAFSFFDIREAVADGVARETAVEDIVDHYLEVLTQIMGRDRFEQAVRSPDIIRYLVKALFDPVHGEDAFSHRALHGAARRMHERQSAPAVSDPDLERMLAGVVANRKRTFDELMQGVANRLEKVPVDRRLARVFNHVPAEDDPQFDLADYLNEDVVIVIDTGRLRSEAQRTLAVVLLSNLWTALKRRAAREEGDQPLVNLYLEEAASIAVSDVLSELLAQARGFGCSVTLAMQYPAQLRSRDEGAYEEVLNNVGSIITGPVPSDRGLAERLATDEMDADRVATRLRALQRGEWVVSLPAGFGETPPRPFLVGSPSPPPTDPTESRPLAPDGHATFEAARDRLRDRVLAECGLQLASPSTVDAEDQEEASDAPDPETVRVDSALPHTTRLPPTVEYDAEIHACRCRECDARYDPSIEGVRRATNCCGDLDAVDPADIPICDLNLKLTPAECRDSEFSTTQLLFLQAVYNAQQLRYEPPAYDLLHDSMIRLQEYVGIESAAVDDLCEAGVLTRDTDHPHRLYTVTPDGRKAIGEHYREGVDYGHGQGDLEETSQHVFAVEVARRYLEADYVEDPESDVAEVIPYYDLDGNRRLDVAGVDEHGEFEVVVEVERVNHDLRRAVPEDFDKLASCDPAEAIWVVMSQSDGHEVLTALNDPLDEDPRVEKTYASTTPPQQFRIDTPGLTAMFPVTWLRDRVDDEEPAD
ncbi:type IV secretory system conjugative DNA transfer family protein [Haloparvum alkalitolerans]|uniref:type IV secretory system conjugative DNA transfer family protein n=1 Tax=Haloparvum alkalitolerans TaxID=1042953 RepID=UPI003CEC482C